MEKLQQFFIDRNSAKSTQWHYHAAVKLYTKLHGMTLDELIEEADYEEEQGIRWKKRKLKQRLIEYRNYLYSCKSEGTAKQYLTDIKTIYRHYEIELQDLPNFISKNIDNTYEMSYNDILTKEEIIDAYYEANNVTKCIILFASSSGLSKVDILKMTVEDFVVACDCKNKNLIDQLQELKKIKKLIPCFIGERQKTNKKYITFCSPEASQHIVQYLIGRDAQIRESYSKGDSEYSQLCLEDKLFDISESHLSTVLRGINSKLDFGVVGKHSKFRCHMLRKFQATTLINVENGFTVEEIDTLQGRSQDKTHRAYFHNSREKLFKKYVECVDDLMLFESIHEVDKHEYEQMAKKNVELNNKLEVQQKTIDEIIANQRELEKLLGFGE